MQKKILITGATGNVGGALLPLLAQSEHHIFAGSSRGGKIGGVEGRCIDFLNVPALTKAFRGMDTVFVVIPLHPKMIEMAANVATAAKAAGVQHIVRVSGAGADPASPIAVARVQGLADQHLSESGIACTFLCPKNFMQNFVQYYAKMIRDGALYSSQGEGKIAFIDVRDIAAVAKAVILNPEQHAQKSYVLTGPQALTNAEVLALIDAHTGKHTQYVTIPEEAAVSAMQQMGMPPFVVEVMSSLNQIIAAGYVADMTDVVQRVTGHAPRSFEAFVEENGTAWRE